jgi:hypothetical protein
MASKIVVFQRFGKLRKVTESYGNLRSVVETYRNILTILSIRLTWPNYYPDIDLTPVQKELESAFFPKAGKKYLTFGLSWLI